MSVLSRMMKRTRFGNGPGGDLFSKPSADEISRQILELLIGGQPLKNVGFRFWNGRVWPDETKEYPAVLTLTRPSSLREMFLPGSETGVGEAYMDGAFEVEGEIEKAFELADLLMEKTQGWTRKLDLGRLLRRLPEPAPVNGNGKGHGRAHFAGNPHSLERDRRAIDFHYNVSNDFYALWLGREMAYSCAYFQTPGDDLDTAQTNKFDLICRKLGLRPGDRFLDIGCGWGGLIRHAARHYGVQAEGITLSTEQLKLAQARNEEAGLAAQISVRLVDYRELPDDAFYDAVASVGMVEHVGRGNLPLYFRKIMKLLKPGGLFLNHGIGIGPVGFPGNSGSFIQDHVFPDSDLIQIGDMTQFAEHEGWEVRDVENLRLHYAQTLREWLKGLEAARSQALRHVDERTYRVWRLYMAGCAHNFQTARLAIYQTLLAKIDAGGESRAPEVRGVWYR